MRTLVLTICTLSMLGCDAAGTLRATTTPQSKIERPAVLSLRPQAAATPHASRVVLVMMENHDYGSIVGSSDAPYINNTLIPQGTLMTNSHALSHPSQPNYLQLFSGSNQGITDDSCPHTITAASIASELIASGKTFTGYAESMPSIGYTGCSYGSLYARKHNPWVNFPAVPAADNVPYTGVPSSAVSLPSISSFAWLTPNLCDDMHDCTTKTGDAWLAKNLPPIIASLTAHQGLLILTWDEAEPDNDGTNHIATILVGPTVFAGYKSSQQITHYNVCTPSKRYSTCLACSRSAVPRTSPTCGSSQHRCLRRRRWAPLLFGRFVTGLRYGSRRGVPRRVAACVPRRVAICKGIRTRS